jgi:acetolactate synthase-1/2/3 large subunit
MDSSDAFVSALVSAGVEVCFANPGTTELNFVSALDKQHSRSDAPKKIQAILCLHENVCTGAADGYARMSKRPALGLLHLGPGLANGLSNLHNARRANSPVLILVGEMVSWLQDADPVLRMDIPSLAATVSAAIITFHQDAAAAAATAAQVETNSPSGESLRQRFCMSMCPGVGGRVATLVLPHDAMWGPADVLLATSAVQAAITACKLVPPNPGVKKFANSPHVCFNPSCRTCCIHLSPRLS